LFSFIRVCCVVSTYFGKLHDDGDEENDDDDDDVMAQ